MSNAQEKFAADSTARIFFSPVTKSTFSALFKNNGEKSTFSAIFGERLAFQKVDFSATFLAFFKNLMQCSIVSFLEKKNGAYFSYLCKQFTVKRPYLGVGSGF